jgi:hypothetical protein
MVLEDVEMGELVVIKPNGADFIVIGEIHLYAQ